MLLLQRRANAATVVILLIYIHILLSLFSIKSTLECILHFNDTGLQAF